MTVQQQTILECDTKETAGIVNVASVPQRSPFRYPGGKTWFVPRLRAWLESRPSKPEKLIEPFLGGGVISLTSVAEELVGSAIMLEVDQEVASIWKLISSGDCDWLADEILSFEMTYDNVVDAIEKEPKSTRELAFRTILKNRCYHGGILAEGSGLLKYGEAGKWVASRWYPDTLARRLRDIDSYHQKLEFYEKDAFLVLDEYGEDENVVFFIDPPYTAGGKKAGSRLYRHHELDHAKLFDMCAGLAGDFIMTYDNADEVMDLAEKHNLEYRPIPMRNTHHAAMNELVIGRDLDWMEGIELALKKKAEINHLKKKAKLLTKNVVKA